MARTHAARPQSNPTSRFHQDDGVVLGKGGEPIPTTPVRGIADIHPHGSGQIEIDPVAPVVSVVMTPTAPEYVYYCDKTTWQRNMDGWQALQLLNVMLGTLSAEMNHEAFMKLPADCRWHMKRRVKEPTV